MSTSTFVSAYDSKKEVLDRYLKAKYEYNKLQSPETLAELEEAYKACIVHSVRVDKHINVGDTVRVIGLTRLNNEDKELIPIGTVCTVFEKVCDGIHGSIFGVRAINRYTSYYYLAKDLEKGSTQWVSDENFDLI